MGIAARSGRFRSRSRVLASYLEGKENMNKTLINRAAIALAVFAGASLVQATIFTEADQSNPANYHNTKATAQLVAGIQDGDQITGTSNGQATTVASQGTLGAADYYKLTLPATGVGVYKNIIQMNNTDYTSPVVTFTGTIRGLNQTHVGPVNVPTVGSDSAPQQTLTTPVDPSKKNINQFYSFGKATSLNYRVAGASAATEATPYFATYSQEQISVQDLGTFQSGQFRIFDTTDQSTPLPAAVNTGTFDSSNRPIYTQEAPSSWINYVKVPDTGFPNFHGTGSYKPSMINTKVFVYNAATGDLVFDAVTGAMAKSDDYIIGSTGGFNLDNLTLLNGDYYVVVTQGNGGGVDGYVDAPSQTAGLQGGLLDDTGIVVSDFNPTSTMILPQGQTYPGYALGFAFASPDTYQLVRSNTLQGFDDAFIAKFTVVPEPSSAGLLLALAPVALRRRR